MENIVCTFDEYSTSNTDICGGLNFNVESGKSYLSGIQIDSLPNVRSTYITDYSSISKKKESNRLVLFY